MPFVVNSSSGLTTGSGPYSLTISSTKAGDLIIVGINGFGSGNSVSGITDNAPGGSNGYASAGVRGSDANSGISEIWYAANTKAGATTISVSMSQSNAPYIYVLEVGNMNTTSPLGAKAPASSQSATTTPAAPSVTTSFAHSVVFSIVVVQNTVTGLHAGNPFTPMPILTGDDAGYLFATATGAYAGQWDQNISGTYCASTAEFYPAS